MPIRRHPKQCQALLKEPVGALSVPGADSPTPPKAPAPDTLLLLLLPALVLPLPPPLMLRSLVVRRELGFAAPGFSIHSNTSAWECDAMPTSSTR